MMADTVWLQWETEEDPSRAHWSGLDSHQTAAFVRWIRERFGVDMDIASHLPEGTTGIEVTLADGGTVGLKLSLDPDQLDSVSEWLVENIGEPDGVQ